MDDGRRNPSDLPLQTERDFLRRLVRRVAAVPPALWRGPVTGSWRGLSGRRATAVTEALVLLGLATLFLHAAATIEIGYTLRVSYVLLLAACAVGLPHLLRGVVAVPPLVRWAGAALLLVALLAMATGAGETLTGDARGGARRGIAYVADLLVGMGVAALCAGLWGERGRVRPALKALLAGGVLAALYGIYQWVALEAGLPLANVNNALNSDGLTRGELSQGTGLFGTERIRGTFVEPHFLGGYLATMLPVAVALSSPGRQRRRLAIAVAALIVVAILLTASAPAWLGVGIAAPLALAAWAVGRGRPVLAGATAAAAVLAVFGATLVLVDPAGLAATTGRSAAALESTAEFRTNNWQHAVILWSERPALGFGPGQSAVQLSPARWADPGVIGLPVLGSAHGLWSAALVDTGVVGFWIWLVFLAAVLTTGWRAVVARPGLLPGGLFAAACAGLAAGQVSGDRLELRVWVLLGLVLALGGATRREHEGERGEQAREPTADRPAPRDRRLLAHEASR